MILFVADGARWIWNRVGALLRRLGIKPGQVNELVDFYHAVEHLGTIAALQRRWAGVERQHWTRISMDGNPLTFQRRSPPLSRRIRGLPAVPCEGIPRRDRLPNLLLPVGHPSVCS